MYKEADSNDPQVILTHAIEHMKRVLQSVLHNISDKTLIIML
jgi:hypothetical protein